MRGLVKAMGHPLHAMLSDFPMVLLLMWVWVDAAALITGAPLLWLIGKWALVAGLVAAGGAAVFGFLDYLTVTQTRPAAATTATSHMLLMLGAVSIAATTLVFRPASPPLGLERWLLLGAVGLVALCLLAGGWFGGHLVFHHGVGVEAGDRERP